MENGKADYRGEVLGSEEVLAPLPADVFCVGCGYNLYGAVGRNCPECGYGLEHLRSVDCRIPWASSDRKGYFLPFWRTVGKVLARRRYSHFWEEVAGDVSLAHASSFRWVVVFHLLVVSVLAVVLLYSVFPAEELPEVSVLDAVVNGGTLALPTFWERAYGEVWPVGLLVLCFGVFLILATGIPSYFFHPRAFSISRQNAAVALSYYTCAPLAILAVVVAALGCMVMFTVPPSSGEVGLVLSAVVVAGFSFWWLKIIHAARRILPGVPGRVAVIAISIPVLWTVLFILAMVVLPSIILSLVVVIASLV